MFRSGLIDSTEMERVVRAPASSKEPSPVPGDEGE
jgi:hypothetical protein